MELAHFRMNDACCGWARRLPDEEEQLQHDQPHRQRVQRAGRVRRLRRLCRESLCGRWTTLVILLLVTSFMALIWWGTNMLADSANKMGKKEREGTSVQEGASVERGRK